MSGNGGMHPDAIKGICKGLECSPSKSQSTSTLPGTKGNLAHGTSMAKGGSGGGTKHKKGSKLGAAKKM